VKHETVHASLVVSAYHGLEVRHFDVKSAFLNGVLEKDLYMEQPPGFIEKGKEGLVVKLSSSIYGLKQSVFIYNLFSHQCNYFLFSPPPHDMFRPQTAIIRCLKYAKTVALYKMHKMFTYSTICKCDASCLIYLMYTRYLCALINFIRFLI
jgi:hypothetical protein